MVAAKRHEVYPLGRYRHLQRLRNVVHNISHTPEQLAVTGPIDDVSARCKNRVPEQRGISAEERDYVLVGIHGQVYLVRMPAQIRADKAWPFFGSSYMCREIELRHRCSLRKG